MTTKTKKPKPNLFDEPSTTCLIPWFGSNRLLAEQAGKALAGCEWVGVPFMGGGAELLHIKARTIMANDLHFHMINLAMTLAHPVLGPQLYRRVRRKLFHHDEHQAAQDYAKQITVLTVDEMPDIEAAESYFVSQWMGRSGISGTDSEFHGNLPYRWNAGGGDNAIRYRSAVRSMLAWRRVLLRCTFTCLDAFAFIDQVKDEPKHGLYVDGPWPDDGDRYRHKFDARLQARLAFQLALFEKTRVVVRFGDHPLIRDLYPPANGWRWIEHDGRTQANKAKREVLIIRNGGGA